jgi:hypothetical protein
VRKTPLKKEEKEEAEKLLRKLDIHPDSAAQVIFNLDSQGKVASAELARVVWR